jgi:hypothetical protein
MLSNIRSRQTRRVFHVDAGDPSPRESGQTPACVNEQSKTGGER